MDINMVCEKCGGSNVTRDSSSKWDIEKQEWVTVGLMDNSTCEDCMDECEIEEIEI